MVPKHLQAVISILTLLLILNVPRAATLTIDETQEYQSIEGLGTALGGLGSSNMGQYIDDLGASVLRCSWGYDEVRNDSKAASKKKSIVQLAALYENEAKKRGLKVRTYCSWWTPMAFMKTNNSLINGGNLKPEARSEFGDSLVSCIRQFKQGGVDLYGISPQNEPKMAIWYVSCVYNPQQYAEMLKVVGPKIRTAYPKVNIIGPDEAHGSAFRFIKYMKDRDREALKYLDILGVHQYVNAADPDPAAAGSQLWSSFGNQAKSLGVNLWVTELSGFEETWESALEYGRGLFSALKYADLTCWTWWKFKGAGGVNGEKEALIGSSGPRRVYYVSKQYYKWIRPDAVRIGCDEDLGEDVFGVAFRHKANKTLTVVVINNSTAARTLTLSGHELPTSFERYLSDNGSTCSSKGTVSTGGSISLPARSITTLFGKNYDPSYREPTTMVRDRDLTRPAATSSPAAGWFTVDGRHVRFGSTQAQGVVSVQRAGRTRVRARIR